MSSIKLILLSKVHGKKIIREMIRAVVQLELKNIDIAEQILFNIESNHKELFSKQYMMVAPFIQALKLFINTPEKATKTSRCYRKRGRVK